LTREAGCNDVNSWQMRELSHIWLHVDFQSPAKYLCGAWVDFTDQFRLEASPRKAQLDATNSGEKARRSKGT
jgi:hypothetical protein